VTIESGDTVSVDCVSGGPEILPRKAPHEILPDPRAVLGALEPKLGAHILTGPIAIPGAEPGDVLQIDILAIAPRQNWGYTRIRPLAGTLPEEFPVRRLWHSRIDRQRGLATLPWGPEIALAPFFGVMGVAPRPVYGAVAPGLVAGTAAAARWLRGRASSAATWASTRCCRNTSSGDRGENFARVDARAAAGRTAL
jgi:acetamidase/formamidase